MLGSFLVDTPSDPTSNRRQGVSGPPGVKCATGHMFVGDQAAYGNKATGTFQQHKPRLREAMRIGTWNVQGMLQPGKLAIIEKEMREHNIGILGLSETHWKEEGHFVTSNGNTVYFTGHHTQNFSGVAFVVSPQFNNIVLSYSSIMDRIILIKLDTKPVKLNIIQVYAPTTSASEEFVSDFYNKLQDIMQNIPSREITIIAGDLNAKVGKYKDQGDLKQVIGRFGVGERNERGEKLIDFCIQNKLVITNTTFNHHIRRLYTWKSPGDRYRNQIDYIMINQRWKSSIMNTKTYPGADCNSDHQLLVTVLRIKLNTSKKITKSKRMVIYPSEKQQFRALVDRNIQDLKSTEDCETIWNDLKTSINIAHTQILSQRNNIPIKKQWMSLETWQLIEQRKNVKKTGLTEEQQKQEYQQLNRLIQKNCRQDQNTYLNAQCDEVQSHAEKNQVRDLFKKIKEIVKDFKPKTWAIEDKNGMLLTDKKQITERWREYCEELYFDEQINDQQRQINNTDREPEILKSEVEDAIKKLKNNKAPGIDEVTGEILKELGDEAVNIILKICNLIWETGIWPKDWTTSVMIPLHKKGSTRKCNNYRTLSLISHTSKVLLHIINNRLRHYVDNEIAREQAGFVKGRGTRNQIVNIRQMIEKCREYNVPMVMCFIDYNKAFDFVNWSRLWEILNKMSVPDHLINLIKNLYLESTAVVKIEDMMSKDFHPQRGVRQGCILSATLFNIYGEAIMRNCLDEWEGGILVGGEKISNLRYADDTTIFAATEEEMATLLSRIEQESAKFGLTINKTKTKLMIVDKLNVVSRTHLLDDLERVNNFVYLGSTISNMGGCVEEVKRRIAMAKSAMLRLTKIWKSSYITRKTKMNLIRTLVFPVFSYGSESWTLRDKERKYIDSFEMWCYRRMLRIPWTARRTNQSILEELNITTRLSSLCMKRVLQYFGHIARRPDNNIDKLIVMGEVHGKRSRGRSPMRWSDQIRQITSQPLHVSFHQAEDRVIWRNTVEKGIEAFQRGHDPHN
ncbi:unnamed protein product [Callosobruchus maculatus]|uniref:Reverse transcriptase domain-containing protein n=1 Tax=Callosobruchus maculatus TaxID=64391 RepID=A0A653BSD4_CALMS|nr:unnamed protein product [Callosobruchus maculatus]